MTTPQFKNIKQFPHCSYRVDVAWDYLEEHILNCKNKDVGIDLNPDFQRAHVWTKQQQIDYCEYILKGGSSGRELYFNCRGWMNGYEGPYVIVDGKQRLQAVRLFMSNKIPVFGAFYNEYTDRIRMHLARFSWNVAALETRKEVLEWYLNFNSGGTIHTQEELQKVEDLLILESKREKNETKI